MNYLRPLVLIATVATLAAPVWAAQPDIKAVEGALLATSSMTAQFRQTAANGQVMAGTLSLKRPGRIRFDYGDSAKYLVVADGQHISFVDYKVSQVSEWPIRSTPLGVLLDPKADLSRIARVLPESASPIPGMVAVEAQDRKRPDYGKITFFLKPNNAVPGGLALTGWRVIDAQNNLTQVELFNTKYNVDISNNIFKFRDPRPKRIRPPGKTG